MNKITPFTFLLGFLLAGSTVVADDASPIASGNKVTANPRRTSAVQPHASAMDAASATISNLNQLSLTNTLPPLPPGVIDLKFSEFFRQPIGPRGLEYTDRLRSLEGRRIRILGYMVRQDQPVARRFLLSPVSQTLHQEEYGPCDDLPATTVHVCTSAESPTNTPFTPGLLLLTGKLSLGNRTEADGRISTVRLELDAPTPEQQSQAAHAAAARPVGQSDHAGHVH